MSKKEKPKFQTLHCDQCKDWLKLEFKKIDETIDGIHIMYDGMPFLFCPKCNKEYKTDFAKGLTQHIVDMVKEKGENSFRGERNPKAPQKRFDFCKNVNFKYHSSDWKVIPGLVGLTKEGFFTPVFFNKEVLHKYIDRDEYRVDIAGNTLGTIFHKDDWSLTYGINPNGKVFCWLGDLDEIPEDEQSYLLSENVDSDHDVASEFYASTREAEFAEYSNEQTLLNSRSFFDDLWNDKFSSKIFRYEKDVYTVLEDLVTPVIWNKKGIMRVVNSLNKLCVESINKDSIISAIKKKEPKFQENGMKGLKLMEKLLVIAKNDGNAQEIMKPFFTLYDLRLILDHDFTEDEEKEKLDYCYERMSLKDDDKNLEKLYSKLMEEMINSYNKIVKVLSEYTISEEIPKEKK